MPWSPLLVLHRRKLFTAWKPDLADTYLLLNAGLIFLVFSLMVTKLPHYTLPAFPFLALLLARRWSSIGFPSRTLCKLGWISGVLLAALTAVCVPLALVNHVTPSPVGELVREAQGVLTPNTEFAVVDFQEPNTIWEMRRVVKGYGHAIGDSEVIAFLDQPGPRAVVLSSALWSRLAGPSHPSWKVVEARGFNAAKLGSIDLTLVVKP